MGVAAEKLIPIKDRVFVTDMESGERVTRGGIIITDDDGKERGIRDRWARVFAVGPDAADDLKKGDWILVAHGRWTPGVDLETSNGTVRVWLVEYPESVLVVSDEDPRNRTTTGRTITQTEAPRID